jgi:hypothetical protein
VDLSSGVALADISAHARAVTAVDVHPTEDTVRVATAWRWLRRCACTRRCPSPHCPPPPLLLSQPSTLPLFWIPQFVSVGEDAVLNVWHVGDKAPVSPGSVHLLSSVPLDDQILTGVQFCKASRGHPIIVTSYDNNIIPVILP